MKRGDPYLTRLRILVLDFFKEQDVKVVLFGSRAKGTHRSHSDVDVGIVSRRGRRDLKLFLLKDRVEESTIPYKVDIVDLSKTTSRFSKNALKDAVVWKS